ncbi:MAG: dihydrodipicolinate synthase family protein [Oscillospiraceae bacterium]|nr:dihydrodipicolinate synthase family protein [Oscillospiraceae bacterium]
MLKGIYPIIAATFHENGEVDYESFENLIKTLIEGGCEGATLFGIAGEYYKLSADEKEALAVLTVKTCHKYGGKAVISVTEHATEVAVEQAKHFEALGADCLMLLPPFFLKPGAAAVANHIRAVAKAVKIPVMPQYAPEQTGVAIAPEVFIELNEECPNLEYYKIECKPVGAYLTKMHKQNEKIGIFIGNAGYQLIEGFDRGATGAMPGCSMFDVYLDIYNSYFSGNRERAIKVHSALLPILNHIRQNVEQIIYFEKKILKLRGIIKSDYCRKPSFTSDAIYDKMFYDYYNELAEIYGWKKA